MPITDWTTVSDGTAGRTRTMTLDTTSPAQGTKCMTYQQSIDSGASGPQTSLACYSTITITNRNGWVRTMMRPNQPNGNNHGMHLGVFCLLQTSIAVTNNCYMADVDYNGNLRLLKGTLTGTPTTIGTGAGPAMTQNSWYAISLEWSTNPLTNDVYLLVATDGPITTPSSYTYSTLTYRISTTDSTSPYGAGVSAGLLCRQDTTTGQLDLDRIASYDFSEIALC